MLEKLSLYKKVDIFESTNLSLLCCFSEDSIGATKEKEVGKEEEFVTVDDEGKT